MKSGFARVCITPPLGVAISGYYDQAIMKRETQKVY